MHEVLQPERLVLRNDHVERRVEALPSFIDVIKGPSDWDGVSTVVEHGLSFPVPTLSGPSTGWMFQHRTSRAFFAKAAKGKSAILDVYSHTASFARLASAVEEQFGEQNFRVLGEMRGKILYNYRP